MNKLIDAISKLNIALDETAVEKFEIYMQGVLQWNEKVNLTAISDHDEFVVKHYIDSLMCVTFPEFDRARRVIDVGTGAGFPGIPLSIAAPDKHFVLMDSLNKRLKIIDELCHKAGINNVETVHARAEELARDKKHREKYDLCVSRAVANLATLSEYCLPLVKEGGYFLAYKGPDAPEELDRAKKAIRLLGGRVIGIRATKMEEYGISHNIVVIEKISGTPSVYPRKSGTPSRQPIE